METASTAGFVALAMVAGTFSCADRHFHVYRTDRVADVVSVEVTGEPGGYTFAVGISSPDEGCDQYADWWEVVDENGELLYRRVLTHSHVDEQPFVRPGGPVAIESDRIVWVRAHLQPQGYGGEAFRGSVESGFESSEMPKDFAAGLVFREPVPDTCRF